MASLKKTDGPWQHFDCDEAAVEVLEHAVDLFESGRSLALVKAVAHSAALYFSDKVRPGRKGNSAVFEWAEMMKQVFGASFDEKWFVERAWGMGNMLKHHDGSDKPSEVVLSRNSVAFSLLGAIADCKKSIGAASPKLVAWYLAQVEYALRTYASQPEKKELVERLLALARTRGEAWFKGVP